MWSNQATRWMILIGALWSILAIARCVLHQSFALPPETDASTLALVNLVFGGYFGTWLVLCQKLIFSAEGAAARLAWGCIAVGGIWGLAPDSQEIVQAAEINFERFAGSRGSAGGLKGTSIWLLGVGVAMSLWLVHPLFRSLTIHLAPREATTAPIIQEPAESLGLVRHLWLLRIAVVVGCSYWLKSNINVRSQPSEAFSYWLILLVATALGASLATFPYYLAIIMRRRWLGFIFFSMVWVGVPCVLIALTYTFQTSWPVLPKAVVDSLASIIAPFLVGFSLIMLVSFWSSCFFRDRAILTMPAAVVARINEKKSANGPTLDSGRSSEMSAVWPRIFLVAVAAISLFGAIHWGGLVLQRQFHLGTWWMTDVNHWGRATALARLQHLQDSDPDVARKFQRRHWQYDQPLQTTLDGTVHCVVSAKMANSPAWKLLREDVEFSFKDALWTMDFPVSDPADISGSAYSVLKIDGEGLRLRDLPTAVYPMSWEVFGGSIEDSDYVRGSACYGLSFERCKFVDVDFQRPLLVRHQSLHFTNCTFSEFPRVFPEEVQTIFTLSRPEEFLENHEQFIEAIFNGCQVLLVPPNPKTIDGDQFLLQIPKHWRHLIRISRMPNTERVRVQQTPILSLYTSANELPANFNTRILETNESAQVIGLDFRQWQWHRIESLQTNDDWKNGSELNWIRALLGTGYEADEVAHLAALAGRSWLLQVQDLSGGSVTQLSENLAGHKFVDSGKALYVAGRATLQNLDLLNAFSSREILVLDSQTWPPGFAAGLAKVSHLKRIIVLIAGDTPNATETVDIQGLQAVPGLTIEVLRRPNTTGDLVRMLREQKVTETKPGDE